MRVSSLILLLLALSTSAFAADDILTGGDGITVDVLPQDGRIVMHLDSDIWILPPEGGEALRVVTSEHSLQKPRWSPDGNALLYVAETPEGSVVMIHDMVTSSAKPAGEQPVHSQDPSWHPDGDRYVFASARHDAGLDLWETDLPTGLSWRLTRTEGDEYQPAWSANGEHLVWIHRDINGYSLMLRRRGEPDVALLQSEAPISSPSWRPDGSLLTYLRHTAEGRVLEMAILSEPVLARVISRAEAFIDAPVSWLDRQRMYYTANRQIRSRGFEDRRSRPLHFRAFVDPVVAPPPRVIPRRELAVSNTPDGRLIIRSARLFDGIWPSYRPDMDVVLEGGRILAVENRKEHTDGTVLDLGNVTIIPGFVDAATRFVDGAPRGEEILAYGVTTLAVMESRPAPAVTGWDTEATPGPRVIVIGENEMPANVSGLADGGLESLNILLQSRQSIALGHTTPPLRRFASKRDISDVAGTIVAGSAANRLPPGAGLHAELLALHGSGLDMEQVLRAAGRNAARALGAENQIGVITPGALADLVLVSGDPLSNPGDLLKIVAVVRNGRFFSLVSLLERAASPTGVE